MIPRTGSFSRQRRVRRSQDYRELARRGRRRSTEAFVMFDASTQSEGGDGRLGITVSRRVGNAVVRNRLKRLIREWYRRSGQISGVGQDILVIVRPPAAQLRNRDTWSALDALIGRVQ